MLDQACATSAGDYAAMMSLWNVIVVVPIPHGYPLVRGLCHNARQVGGGMFCGDTRRRSGPRNWRAHAPQPVLTAVEEPHHKFVERISLNALRVRAPATHLADFLKAKR